MVQIKDFTKCIKCSGLSEYPYPKSCRPQYGKDHKHNHPDIFFLHGISFIFLTTSLSLIASVLSHDLTEMNKNGFRFFDHVQDLSAPGMIEAEGWAPPEEYMKYFEDWAQPTNKDIGYERRF